MLWCFLPYINMNQPWGTFVPPPSLLQTLGCPRASALSALLHESNLHWSSILHMVIYMFQCCSLIQISNTISVSLNLTREAWCAVIHGVTKSRTRLSNWTELNWNLTFKVANIFDYKRMCAHLVLDVPPFLFQFFVCLFQLLMG